MLEFIYLKQSTMGMRFYMLLKKITIHCLLPISLGCAIYTFFRKKTILLFDWYEYVGIIDFIIGARQYVNSKDIIYSNFFTQSLRDGLWVYSFTSALLIILNPSNNSIIYSILP